MIDGPAVDRTLAGAVAAGDLPGVVAMATAAAGGAYAGAFGRREMGGAAMTGDTLFWLASLTKPVTAVAVLQLVEAGRLGLDEPLDGLLPELAAVRVLAGFDDDGAPRLRVSRGAITLRRLLSHTAGFGSALFDADIARYHAWAGLPPLLDGRAATLLRSPLLFDPGEGWAYGTGTDWAGRAVERASGTTLETYLRERVFGPLGMTETGFRPTPEQRARRAVVHRRQVDGSLAPVDVAPAADPEVFLGGGGLSSTGPDFARFLRMLLRGGELDGVRVLRPESAALLGVAQAAGPAVGRLRGTNPALATDVDPFPGAPRTWGFGGVIAEADVPAGRGAGSWGWSGLANCHYWLDPGRGVAAVLLAQTLPLGDARARRAFRAFEAAVYGTPS